MITRTKRNIHRCITTEKSHGQVEKLGAHKSLETTDIHISNLSFAFLSNDYLDWSITLDA